MAYLIGIGTGATEQDAWGKDAGTWASIPVELIAHKKGQSISRPSG
jgi:hypothetical protein